MEKSVTDAVGTRKLSVNALWNIAGVVLPLIVGLVAVRLLIDGLGKERFGVFVLAFGIVGYFSLLDLGIGRALTQVVAQRLGSGQREELLSVSRSALSFMAVLGVVGGIMAVPISNWYVKTQLNIAPTLIEESLRAFHVLALSVPIVIMTAGLRGILEGMHEFKIVNTIRIPFGMLNFLAPVAVLPFDPSLPTVVGVLLLTRLFGLVAFAIVARRAIPGLFAAGPVKFAEASGLLRLAGWMAVSNVVGPLMVQLDRYVIGARLSVDEVAYYTPSFDAVFRMLVVPAALVAVLFPAFATLVLEDRDRARRLYDRGWAILIGVMGPIFLAVFAFAPELIELWLGADMSAHSSSVARLILIGAVLNTVTRIPFVLIQGAGRPVLTAAVHLVELPLYLIALSVLLTRYGIEGAAMAWSGRIVIDLLLFGWIGHRMLPPGSQTFQKTVLPVFVVGGAFVVAYLISSFGLRLILVVLISVMSAVWLWVRVIGDDLREQLLRLRPGAP